MPRTCYRKKSGALAGRRIAAAALLGFSLCFAGCASQESQCVITRVAGTGEEGDSGHCGPATQATLYSPDGLALDGAGNLYIADSENGRVRKVDARTGVITTVTGTGIAGDSGDGGLATQARFRLPTGLALDGAGNLYIADHGNHRVRRVDALTGVITTVAGTGEDGYSGDGRAATEAQLHFPDGLALDGAGNLYIADTVNGRVRRVDGQTGVITTVAGTGEWGYSGDGGPATEAELNGPVSLAIDATGNLYIADTVNRRVRRVDGQTGVITTVAGTGEWGYSGDGGPATEAELARSAGLAFDGAGNLYIADSCVRRVDALTGVITTVAGCGAEGFSWDRGAATSAQGIITTAEEAMVNMPCGLAFDGAGNLYIADSFNHRVLKVDVGCFRRDR